MANEQTATGKKRVLTIIANVLVYIFFAICILALVVSVTVKKDSDGAMTVFGTQIRIVVSDSMAACPETAADIAEYEIGSIPLRAMIFTKVAPEDPEEKKAWYDSLKVGDVVTFKYVYTTQETITHRISHKAENANGGYDIYLVGDNRASETGVLSQYIDTSEEDSPNYIIGKVTAVNYPLGLAITAMKHPIGIVCIVIIPCLIIMILEIIRIYGLLTAKKREAQKAENERRDSELEELRAKLAMLTQNADEQSPEAAEPENTENKEKTDTNPEDN